MGETYKGLTIKIGADTTSLAQALQRISSAARTAQTQLKKVEQGLRFDPTNAVMLGAKIDIVSERMTTLATKASTIGLALGRIDSKVFEKLRDDTYHAAYEAEIALQHYNRLDNELAILRTHLKGYADEFDIDYDEKIKTDDLIAKAGDHVRNLPIRNVITSFAGLRAHEEHHEFIIKEVDDAKNFIDCAGIESPGLTSSPAIGEMVGNQKMVDKINALLLGTDASKLSALPEHAHILAFRNNASCILKTAKDNGFPLYPHIPPKPGSPRSSSAPAKPKPAFSWIFSSSVIPG